MTEYSAWIGRERMTHSLLDPWRAAALAATLDLAADGIADGAPLPILWHWLYFLEIAPAAQLSQDGHARRGAFLPPVAQPRRMFAGARIEVVRPLRLGNRAERRERIASVTQKSGRAGSQTFVTVAIEIAQAGDLCIREEQDLVYLAKRGRTAPRAPAQLPDCPWCRTVTPDQSLLFRFSALTFNAHRIHLDREYARTVEGYADLVVHGPLTAILLAELARAELGRSLARFDFRAIAPLFCDAPITLLGRPDDTKISLSAHGPDGSAAMLACGTPG